MRCWIALACLVGAGCSSAVNDPPTYSTPPPPTSPTPAALLVAAKAAANAAKFVGPVEVSSVREAHPLAPAPYISCIRGINSVRPTTQTVAMFFKGDSLMGSRLSVQVDNCEAQAFTVLGNGPF
jgi:hypothetical protein